MKSLSDSMSAPPPAVKDALVHLGCKPCGAEQSLAGAKPKPARGYVALWLGADLSSPGLMAELIGEKTVGGSDE